MNSRAAIVRSLEEEWVTSRTRRARRRWWSGVDDHASYVGESFAAKHLECALAPSTPKALEAAAKALAA